MNSKQRILAALECHVPDRVPIAELQIDEPVVVELARILGLETHRPRTPRTLIHSEETSEVLGLYCLAVRELALDATCLPFSIGLERLTLDRGRDKYGCVYRLSPHGSPMVLDGPIQDAADLRGYDMVSQLKPDDFARVRHVTNKVGEDKAHFMVTTDPFKQSWLLRGGMSNLLLDYSLDPALVHSLARITTDWNLAVAEMAVKLGLGVDVLVMVGDLAGEQTTLISPEHYREYIKPYHSEIVNHAHRLGLRIVKHTDGNAWPILDDFVEVGFDGFNPVQPQCMDIAEVKGHVAGKLCLVGNIDCRHLLPFGTEEEVVEVVKETIAKAAPGGGYIICSSNSVHAGCKARNYLAMVRAAHEYGVYEHMAP